MQHFFQQITPFVSEYGLIIIFIGMMVEGTAMILLTGLLCYHGVFSIEEAWAAAAFGAVAGDNLWFYLGNTYGRKILNRFPSLKEKSTRALSLISSKADMIAFSARFIVLNTLVKTMHFQCKALASTNVLKVRMGNEKWEPYNKPIASTYRLGNKIQI